MYKYPENKFIDFSEIPIDLQTEGVLQRYYIFTTDEFSEFLKYLILQQKSINVRGVCELLELYVSDYELINKKERKKKK